MPQYVLLVSPHLDASRQYSPEELQRMTKTYMDWVSALVQQGRFIGGQKLKSEARRLHGAGNGQIVMDGPYTEAKELIGGFFQIEAGSYDEAVEIAKGCPVFKVGGSLEVREIDPV